MAIPAWVTLYPDNTQVLQVQGLADVTSGTYLNSATVSATLLDVRGQADPVLNNIPLYYVTASNGNYQGTVSSEFSPPAFVGKTLNGYTLQIIATQSGVQAFFSINALISPRSQS